MESATIKVGRIQIGNKWRIVVDPSTQALTIQFSHDNFVTVIPITEFVEPSVKDPVEEE
jgi:hypothetical protein